MKKKLIASLLMLILLIVVSFHYLATGSGSWFSWSIIVAGFFHTLLRIDKVTK